MMAGLVFQKKTAKGATMRIAAIAMMSLRALVAWGVGAVGSMWVVGWVKMAEGACVVEPLLGGLVYAIVSPLADFVF